MPRKKNALATALAARFGKLRTTAKRGKGEICKAAASVRDGRKKETKMMKNCGTESNISQKIANQNRKVRIYGGVDTATNGQLNFRFFSISSSIFAFFSANFMIFL